MSTWEERMSQRAKARVAARVEAEAERIRQQYAHFEATMPALPGEDRILPGTLIGDHAGHLSHRCRGGTIMCSCGDPVGLVCFVPTDADREPCEICQARKVGRFAK